VRAKRKVKTIKAIKVEKVDFPFTTPDTRTFDDAIRNLIICALVMIGIFGIAVIL